MTPPIARILAGPIVARLIGVVILLGLIGLSAANAAPASRAASSCFNIQDWNGWRLSADGQSMYIRVGASRIYRLDVSGTCRAAQDAGAHLVTRTRGSSQICSPLDLDLRVSDGHGFATPCLVRRITPLTAEEAAALPKGDRP